MRPVLISLVITTYNRAELLAGALKSVAASQFDDHGNVEVIVVDNNSTDGTRQTVENIREEGFPFRLRYVVEPNQGLSYARNRGIDESDATFVAFMDDDQLLGSEFLSRLAPAFESTSAVCVGGPLYLNNRGLVPKWLPPWLYDVGELDIGRDVKVLDGSESKKLIGGNMAFVREELVNIGKYDVALGRSGGLLLSGEEVELQERLHAAGKKVVYHPDLVQYHNFTLDRQTKHYWRKFFFNLGRSRYRRLGGRNPEKGPLVFGAPRWLWRHLLMGDIPSAARALARLHSAEIFEKQLDIWLTLGQIYEARREAKEGNGG